MQSGETSAFGRDLVILEIGKYKPYKLKNIQYDQFSEISSCPTYDVIHRILNVEKIKAEIPLKY
jgi:hypothetical protein